MASIVDHQISTIEKEVVEAAEAMPEDKFNFSPEGLNLQGSDYKGVRSFALQVKHVAASNYILWSALTGDKFPQDYLGGNGPEDLEDQSRHHEVSERFFCPGAQGRSHADPGEHVADTRA